MSLGNGNIHQKGEIPEITKLYNNRIRVIRRFQKFTREDVDNTNLGSLMGDFGDLDTTGEQIVGQGYTDCRLISVEVDNRFNQQANADNPVLVKTYETLTGSFVQIDADVELTEQNGLKTVTKVFRAKTGTTSSGVVGTTTSGSLVLASSKIEDNGAFAELTEVFSEKGILNVETPKVGGVQQVVVTALGLSESLVTSELSQVTANHKLVNQATQNFNGFQTIAYTFEVDDFEVFVTEDGELTNVVKTELSSSSITRGTIGTTNITVSGKTFLLQKEELDNDGLIKKSIQTFIGLESASFPATQIFEIDSRYGVGLPIERQVVAPSEATGSVGATESVQVEPINSFSSVKFTATKASADAIASQVWYDRRNVTFPAQLKSIVAVGTESPVVVANYINAPTSPLKIKTTRTFHWGAPDDDSGTTERVFLDTSFSAAIEITTLTERTSESSSNSISSNKSISSSISNSENNSNSTSSSQNASNSSSTSNSTTNSSNSSENNSRTSASGNSSSTSSGTSSSTGTSTTSSTNTGTSSNSSTNSSTGTSTNNGTSNSSNNSSSTSSGSGSSSSTSTSENNSQNEGSSTSKASSKGISSTVSNTDTVGTSDTSTNVSSTSNSSTSSNSNTNSSANSTSSGSSNSRSSSQTSGNSNVASSGSSNSQVSSSGTSDVTTDSNGKSDSVVDSDVTIVSSQTNNDSTVTSDVDSRGDSDTEVNTTTQSAIDKPVYISATERNTKDRTTTSLINSYKHISSKVKTDVRGTGNSTTNTSSHNSNNSKSSTNSIIRSDNTNNTTSSTSNNNVISTSSTGNSSSTSDGSSNTTSSVSSNSSGSSASTVSSNNSVNGTSSGAVQSTTDSRSEGSSDNTVNSTSINVGSSAVSSSSTSNSNSSSTGTSSVQSITQSSNESSSQSSVESQNASRSQGEGQSQSTTQSATDSTSTSQSTSTGASESSNSGTSSSINNGTSNSSGTSSNSGTNNSTSSNSGTSNSNSTSNNEGESTSNGINKNTGKRIVTVNLRSCLRSSQTLSISGGVSGGGGSIAITGTSPTALPWGNYTEISRRSSHWRNGVWVREIEEALLPAEPV